MPFTAALRESMNRTGNSWSPEVHREMLELFESFHTGQNPFKEAAIKVENGIKYGRDARQRV